MERVRDEPTGHKAERELTDVFQASDETLLRLDGLAPSDEVTFKTVAAPIFDTLGRVLLSLSITGPGHAVPLESADRLVRRLVQSATIATREGRGRLPERDSAVS